MSAAPDAPELPFPKQQMRIVALSQAAAEWLDALGGGSGVVGRTHGHEGELVVGAVPVTRPVGRAEGRTDPFVVNDTVDVPAVARLAPDVVITASRQQAHAVRQAALSAEIVLFAPASFRQMLTTVLDLGHRIGEGRRAMAAIAEREKALATWRARAGISKQQRSEKSVLIAVNAEPIVSGGYWCADLVELAGAEPAFSEPGEPPRTISDEEVLDRRPDHIIAATPPVGGGHAEDAEPSAPEHSANHGGHRSPHIAGSALHILPRDRILFHAGPGLYDTVHWLIETLHGDAAPRR